MNEHKLSKLTLLLMVELLELIHRPKITTHWWTRARWLDLYLVVQDTYSWFTSTCPIGVQDPYSWDLSSQVAGR